MAKRQRSQSFDEPTNSLAERLAKRVRLAYESRPLVDLDETFERVDAKSFPTCPPMDEFAYEIPEAKQLTGKGKSGHVFAGRGRKKGSIPDYGDERDIVAVKVTEADMDQSDNPAMLPLCSSREESLAREMTIARHMGEIGAGPIVHDACIDRNGHWTKFHHQHGRGPLGVIVSQMGTKFEPEIGLGLGNLDRASYAIYLAHKHGIVHGDLQPDNVVTLHGRTVLIDNGRSFYTSDPAITQNEQDRRYKAAELPRFARKGKPCRMY